MYWPAGAPSVFHNDFPEIYHEETHDGLDEHTSNGADVAWTDTDDAPSIPSSDLPDRVDLPALSRTSTQQEARSDRYTGLSSSRTSHLFTTVTGSSISVWRSKPTVILSTVSRSSASLKAYGYNAAVYMRPDGHVLAVQTDRGFLITYSIMTDSTMRSYQLIFAEEDRRIAKRRGAYGPKHLTKLSENGVYIPRVNLRFRMVVKFDAEISTALALEDELVIATKKPPAVQSVKWTGRTADDESNDSNRTELLSNMSWLQSKSPILAMIFDRPMNLYTWIAANGGAYAVQRKSAEKRELPAGQDDLLFRGHAFHSPNSESEKATVCAINAKFSIIAVACKDSTIWIYGVRDYTGGISLLRRLDVPSSASVAGPITTLSYSPDGYCLFVGYEQGWATWSVYGLQGAVSFAADRESSTNNDDHWLNGVKSAFWFGNGTEVILSTPDSRDIYSLRFARSAVATCLCPANLAKALLQTTNGLMIYQGQDLSDLTTISGDVSLWHDVQVPSSYLASQWPIRISVISPDGRYVAVAGQRGLVHYSVGSGRWKEFEDPVMQNSFSVRGGMCWYQNILIASVETVDGAHQIRLISRDQPLDNGKLLHTTTLAAPVVHMSSSGDDSILVYTMENTLHHFVVVAQRRSTRLVKVGEIGLHGIVRAPSRVRAVSWIVPDHQLQSGDPSHDVRVASVFFLIDGKLVLLQPSASESGTPKYDLRVIADRVEYFFLARDLPGAVSIPRHAGAYLSETLTEEIQNSDETRIGDLGYDGKDIRHNSVSAAEHSLRDSLWLFDGSQVRLWTDVNTLLASVSSDYGLDLPAAVHIPVDFYPLTVLLQKAIIAGVEADLVQKRTASFAFSRVVSRSTLFLPSVLRHLLAQFDSPAALSLSHRYSHLPYFAHALEILLHRVLDEEVDNPNPADESALPAVLSFLSSFPEYLDIVVQCTRKTEVKAWGTLFAHLPPPRELFETSLAAGALKTAGGYLLVLQTMDEAASTSPQVIRLLQSAKAAHDWDLCKELARFLIALDESGHTLQQALALSSSSNAISEDQGAILG